VSIPPREPFGEMFSAAIVVSGGVRVLTTLPELPDDAELIAQGTFTVRYGIKYLGKPHLSIVPGLVVLEYGEMLTGVEAWEFLTKRSNLHPRAEVMGYRNDGVDDMMLLRVLDLALPFDVLVYASPDDTIPAYHVHALIDDGTAELPSYLAQVLPRYGSFAEWKASSNV
jgi:hypothetical protein